MKPTSNHSRTARTLSRHAQRGISAVLTSVMLLLAASIAVLYLNRSLIFEQRTAANYTRSTAALEMAEAGIEWAIGMLNSGLTIDTSCNTSSTATNNFKHKYVFTEWATKKYVVPATTTLPGCKVNGNTFTCSCPDVVSGSTTVASLGTTVSPGFTVQFSTVSGDTLSVQITAVGCTATSYACTSSNASASDGPDAKATINVILKGAPFLRSIPASALTCGGSCAVNGSYDIINTDVSTNGVLVNSGAGITQAPGTTLVTLPGIPTANALVANDSSLSALYNADPTCSNSKIFNAYFGSTIAQYAASNSVATISCTSASDCGTKVAAHFSSAEKEKTSFYFPDGFYWNNSSGGDFGSPTNPVTLVTPGMFNINGNINIYGMVYSNDYVANDLGTGTANIYGGIVTCGTYNNNGSGTLQYDAAMLGDPQTDNATWVKVPGSWRDW